MNLKLDVYNDELNLMAYKSSLDIALNKKTFIANPTKISPLH